MKGANKIMIGLGSPLLRYTLNYDKPRFTAVAAHIKLTGDIYKLEKTKTKIDKNQPNPNFKVLYVIHVSSSITAVL